MSGVKLIISDACLGLVESIADFHPEAKWQGCTVHFYRNIFSVVPSTKMNEVTIMLKAIHASEGHEAALEKTASVIGKLEKMKLQQAAQKIRESINETLSYYYFASAHWRRIKTNNPLERIMREIRRRTNVAGAFPDGTSALMLVAARLLHMTGTRWSTKRYLNIELLRGMELEKQMVVA